MSTNRERRLCKNSSVGHPAVSSGERRYLEFQGRAMSETLFRVIVLTEVLRLGPNEVRVGRRTSPHETVGY